MVGSAIAVVASIAMAGRIDQGPANEPDSLLHRRIVHLVEDLRDDDIRWNADYAMSALRIVGTPAIPALEDALWSEDWQQRQLAMVTLVEIQGFDATPSNRMIDVCIEALRDDAMPYCRRGRIIVKNGRAAAHVLGLHIDRSGRKLEQCLESEDYQQRYVASLILGAEGQSRCARTVCATLLPHLRDNDMDGDAVQASAALYGLGVTALPWLMLERGETDEQARRVIDELIRDIADPPDNEDEIVARARPRRERIGWTCHVPHVQIRRPYLSSWPLNLHDPALDE
ncbi:MAG: hypothetical protein KDA20_08300 [Phycisphaerales bacterium]|nr:hypothetical protein [Phycisphaerales bacterium]